MTQEIDALRRALRNAMSIRPDTGLNHLDSLPLRRLENVRRQFTPLRGHRSDERIVRAILSFRMQRENTPFPDIKYACYGIARITDWSGRTLLDESSLFNTLLTLISRYPHQGRHDRMCRAGLVTAFENEIKPGMNSNKNRDLNIALLDNFLYRKADPHTP